MKKSYLVFWMLLTAASLAAAQSVTSPRAQWLVERTTPVLQVEAELNGVGTFAVSVDSVYLPVLISVEIDGEMLWLKQAAGRPQSANTVHWSATEQGIQFRLPGKYFTDSHNLVAQFLVDKKQLKKQNTVRIRFGGMVAQGNDAASFQLAVPPALGTGRGVK
ncbi:MAG TPA: hypothetical protein ENJ10_14190 [Caldithrix abyssi]|uniref:Uncharacterized protein n=1 Tax=Caldithrix abyssi TaxID=187145 RepID=A0A7V1LPL9_CALAY|nr:hypothetical protein [Caldithrix abyssi]